ncbi:MAG: septal ring lytic transglycosylase RlpA family protein, partial [Deltaproteobacteria bacterium]|nr:septal ring lytic transglycosylase RlpA family protein [Deltaproteobacteria bacterium]
HRTLPFGTIVRVRNLANNRSTLVRINDRGPFLPSRVLDVSLRAAGALRMQEAGIAPVTLEIVSSIGGKPLDSRNSFFLALAEERNAQQAHEMSARFRSAVNRPIRALLRNKSAQTVFTLCLGPYATFREAEAAFLSLNFAPLSIIEGPTSPASSFLSLLQPQAPLDGNFRIKTAAARF